MQDDTKSKIQQALAEENDPKFRAIIMLMLATIEDIGRKIDDFRNDEKSLRDAVLNGHAHVHDSDHEWIEGWRNRDAEVRDAFAWVAEKKRTELANRWSFRKIAESVIGQIVIAIGGVLVGLIAAGVIHRGGL